jgi:streptomycin 6-kinase
VARDAARVIEVPEVVRNKALATGGASWLDELPDLVTALCAEWSIKVGDPFTEGTEALVVPATTADGVQAVLKLLVPRSDDAARHEITVLRLAGGQGCAELLRADEGRGAMLLERLGPSMYRLGLPLQQRHHLLTMAASRIWRPAPDAGLPTGAEKGRWLIDFITSTWEALDRPCSERTVDHALACAERRIAAHDDRRAVLVHGDVHEWNALRSADGYKLVDPDGLLAEAEYDLGILMREDPVELLLDDPFDRALHLADLSGLDPTRIWEWGVVERVSTGLLCTQVDLQPVGRQMLDAADHIARGWQRTPRR